MDRGPASPNRKCEVLLRLKTFESYVHVCGRGSRDGSGSSRKGNVSGCWGRKNGRCSAHGRLVLSFLPKWVDDDWWSERWVE